MFRPISKPGTSTRIKTGNWKLFKPIVEKKKCIKCGICHNFCPEGIMGDAKKVPEIDFDYCKGCGICADQCPVKCIEMERVEEK